MFVLITAEKLRMATPDFDLTHTLNLMSAESSFDVSQSVMRRAGRAS